MTLPEVSVSLSAKMKPRREIALMEWPKMLISTWTADLTNYFRCVLEETEQETEQETELETPRCSCMHANVYNTVIACCLLM